MKIPKTLQDSLEHREVVPFVGAGVSMAVRKEGEDARLFPSWRELLQRAADRLEQEEKYKHATLVRTLVELNQSSDYQQAAERARDAFGAAAWYRFLKGQFTPPREQVKDQSLDLARSIWKLGSNLVVTTNYDRVLHWACPNPDDLSYWDIEAPAEQIAALRQHPSRPIVWHLHGFIDNVANLILTPDGYRTLYPTGQGIESRYDAAISALRNFISSHSFLFIGFSLDDVAFIKELNSVHEIFKGAPGPHYALIHEEEQGRVKALGLPIEIIPFSDFGQPLLDLLQQMSEFSSGIKSTSTTEPVGLIETSPDHVAAYDPQNSVFYVPFQSKGKLFFGREKALEALHARFWDNDSTFAPRSIALQGIGGLGKSQFAVEYAYRFRDKYPNSVIWITADQDIDAQLTKLAEVAKWTAPESNNKDKLEIARQRLRMSSECLLIFDNVESVDKISGYLPEPPATSHILMTTRLEILGSVPFLIDPLEEEPALQLLLQAAGQEPKGEEEAQAAQEISMMLDRIPLALEIAGAYLNSRPIGWQSYQGLLKKNVKAALPEKFFSASYTGHGGDIYSTLKVSEQVFTDAPLLKEILDLLAWSGSSPMSESLLSSALGIGETEDLINAIGLGMALRLFQRPSDKNEYFIHRLIAETRREDIPLADRKEWVKTICIRMADWFEKRRDNFAERASYESQIDHLNAWREHAELFAPDLLSRLTWLQAYPHRFLGKYLESVAILNEALNLADQHKENDHYTACILNDISLSHFYLGNFKQALGYAERALAFRRDESDESETIADSLFLLGQTHSRLGNFTQALRILEQSLTMAKKILGGRHYEAAKILKTIGSAQAELGNYKVALDALQNALEIEEENFGNEHPNISITLSEIGITYVKLGNPKVALEYFKKTLRIVELTVGLKHPHTAGSYNNLGTTYLRLGKHSLAINYVHNALDIIKGLYGSKHPDTASMLGNLAQSYLKLGNPDRALDYSEEALKVHRETMGEVHSLTAIDLNTIGLTYFDLGEKEKALDYLSNALKQLREFFGDRHPDTLSCAMNLAQVMFSTAHPLDAYNLLQEFFKDLPKDHPFYTNLKLQINQLLAEPLKKGFRQPPKQGKQKKKKNKKRN